MLCPNCFSDEDKLEYAGRLETGETMCRCSACGHEFADTDGYEKGKLDFWEYSREQFRKEKHGRKQPK